VRRPLVAAAWAAVLLGGALTSCGSDEKGESESEHEAEHELGKAADQSTCLADAKAVDKPYAEGFPDAFVFPPQTTVYNVEDRGDVGVIVTAVSATPFKDILDFLNHDEVDAGFAITEGETEEHDAEANWRTKGQTGRWAIRESASCEGETVIQVLAGPPAG
jgi:hypothetical protein